MTKFNVVVGNMKGNLDSSGVFHQSGVSNRQKATLTLQSVASTRKIEISTNGGGFFFEPEYDSNTEAGLVVVILAPITDFRFSGEAGDEWEYLT